MTTTRRALITSAVAIGAALPIGLAGRAQAATTGPARLRLPAPTGPHPLGTVALHLADRSRQRELMASVWYPARDTARHPRAAWMAPAVLRELLASAGFDPGAARTPLTAGHLGASARGSARPVIVFSHGAHDHRAGNTITVQELASHGYVVVTVDHTDDAFSQFPDGRVIVPSDDPERSLTPRDFAADARFVLDAVGEIAAGRTPDVEGRPLPAGLARAVDLRRIGMFGWSKGGTATAHVMFADSRVGAGLSLDGPMLPAVTGTLDRPFMMATAEFTRAAEPSVAQFWSQLTGWRLNVQADGAIHSSYGDYQVLVPQLAAAIGMSDEELEGWIGTLNPGRAIRIQQAYPLAFFDRHLRNRPAPLLDGPSPAFPEVEYLPDQD
jgi:dienelactone hydrolase